MHTLPKASLLAVLLLVPSIARAQIGAVNAARSIAIEGGVVYATLSGTDFQGTNAGVGLDGQLRFGGRLSLGVGGQFTSHGVDGISEKLHVTGFFAEPRLSLAVPASPLTPFVGARLGYLHESLSSGGNTGSANGWMAGATGGILYHFAPMVNFMAAVMFATIHFGDGKVNGSTVSGSKTSGTSLGLRAGLNIQLGH